MLADAAAGLALVAIAAATNYVACRYALELERKDAVELTMPMASAAGLLASVMLLVLFYFFTSVGTVLLLLTVAGAFGALIFVTSGLWPTAPFLLHCVLAIAAVVSWLVTGHWMLNNVLATALGMLMVASVRLPNLRVGVMLLAGLFLYDIFWVFASASVFGSNVMVAVAMHQAANPVAVAADAVNLHSDLVVATLELPAKLVVPSGPDGSVALGLGDVAIPGVLLCLLYRTSVVARKPQLFSAAMVAYVASLLVAFAITLGTATAQPALLYIVPGVLLPTIAVARSHGMLADLWTGGDLELAKVGQA